MCWPAGSFTHFLGGLLINRDGQAYIYIDIDWATNKYAGVYLHCVLVIDGIDKTYERPADHLQKS